MSKQANYREFTELPAWTRAQWGKPNPVNGDRKVLNDGDPFKWSGSTVEPPAIGARVKCYMNGLGWGTVTSYFVEHGWFGLLVKFDAPPKWYTDQNKGNPPGHIFGVDLEPRKIPDTTP